MVAIVRHYGNGVPGNSSEKWLVKGTYLLSKRIIFTSDNSETPFSIAFMR